MTLRNLVVHRHRNKILQCTMVPSPAAKTAMTRSKIEPRELVRAVGAERQRFDTTDGGKVQLAIKMREQRAAARGFPFQFVTELCRIDVHQHEVVLTGEML